MRDYTLEEIAEMHTRNENFYGTQANFEKLQLYKTVKRGLTEFKERCTDVLDVGGFDPNVREKHAILWMDFSPAAILGVEETAALAAIMTKIDGMVISAVDGHVRITFDVRNIWNDYEVRIHGKGYFYRFDKG